MRIYEEGLALQEQCLEERSKGKRVGLVPTMGNLHAGHLSLIRRCQETHDFSVVSIFVNPLQFNDPKDFDAYPRTLKDDVEMLRRAGVHAVFIPREDVFYGPGFSMAVVEARLSEHACGAKRPGHFKGVCTVVAKLFNLCQPHSAFFGLKDYQQFSVIRKMVQDLGMPIAVVGCPTVREPSGLAMSSRNSKLTAAEKELAAHIYRGLQHMEALVRSHQEATWDSVRALGLRFYGGMDPRCRLEYLEGFEADAFEPLLAEAIPGATSWVICVAVWVGKTRLIDNLILNL
jgi:pantoate--beta-alanine ligase